MLVYRVGVGWRGGKIMIVHHKIDGNNIEQILTQDGIKAHAIRMKYEGREKGPYYILFSVPSQKKAIDMECIVLEIDSDKLKHHDYEFIAKSNYDFIEGEVKVKPNGSSSFAEYILSGCPEMNLWVEFREIFFPKDSLISINGNNTDRTHIENVLQRNGYKNVAIR